VILTSSGKNLNYLGKNRFTITKIITGCQLHSSVKYFTMCVKLAGHVFTYCSNFRPNEQLICFTALFTLSKHQEVEAKLVEILSARNKPKCNESHTKTYR